MAGLGKQGKGYVGFVLVHIPEILQKITTEIGVLFHFL